MKELFWQYPVITEKTFFFQNSDKDSYVGLPWATIIDKNIDLEIIRNALSTKVDRHKFNITCCQHIYFKRLIPLFKDIGIKVLYTPHKVINEDMIEGIIIKPCPLFAVNVEDDRKNAMFKNVDFMNVQRTLLYSFQGAYQSIYLSRIREEILKLEYGTGMGLHVKPRDVHIKNIGEWHFNKTVYSDAQNKAGKIDTSTIHEDNTTEYNEILLKSTFSLCPSGTGPNSIRFWESLAVGSIPVLLSDTLDLPRHPAWEMAIIRVPESQIQHVDRFLRGIPPQDVIYRRRLCLQIYQYFRKDFMNSLHDGEFSPNKDTQIIHYCCGSYDIGDFGGVARYDYHLKQVYGQRRFFKGPEQKTLLLCYAEKCRDLGKNVVVVTDNHLACDIPNYFKVFIVHHGCARKTAERNPAWAPYWKDLCVSGQDKMLAVRDPGATEIISVCREVREDFSAYYGSTYSRFRNHMIYHTSDFDETKVKSYNKNDYNKKKLQILGNFGGKKGDINVFRRSNLLRDYTFNQLEIHGSKFDNYVDFNKSKQGIYLNNDMFLQISNSEGFSYAALDAAACGMTVVSTPVGIFREIPEDCYVKIDVDKRYDIKHVSEKLANAWRNNAVLGANLKQWYQNNCTFELWKNNMIKLLGVQREKISI